MQPRLTFQAALIELGHGGLVSSLRCVHPNTPNPLFALGNMAKPIATQPWDLLQVYEAISLLGIQGHHWLGFQVVAHIPLLLIPYAGLPAFFISAGRAKSSASHTHWYQLLGLSRQQQQEQVDALWEQDVWFGMVALGLELVPFLSPCFWVSNSVASAIWLSEIEDSRHRQVAN